VKNPKGVALERINPELPSNEASSWHSASSETLYGTPGYRNSQYREIQSGDQQKLVWLEPEAFTPDNDGIDDVCMIHYQTESAGYVCNALILTPNGEKVFQIAQNQLLGSTGFLTWDGKTQKGKNVNAGVYVLYFEVFNPTTGNRKKEKLPIVVSFR
jgi:predicted secreted protein